MTQKLETRILHSLVKVFPDEELQAAPGKTQGAALLNEVFSYQVAYRSPHLIPAVKVKAESELGDLVTLRSVGLVPSELPIYSDHDDNVLRSTPGLYPDPLLPLTSGELRAYPGQWRSVWVTVDPKGQAKPGLYPITVRFETASGETLGEERFELEIIGAELPKQQLLHTQWFHADCLATQYGVEAFSERHWELLEQYIRTAADHGINMLLTPLFTPPLDTEVGGERPTVQLVDVEVTGEGQYSFGFDRIEALGGSVPKVRHRILRIFASVHAVGSQTCAENHGCRERRDQTHFRLGNRCFRRRISYVPETAAAAAEKVDPGSRHRRPQLLPYFRRAELGAYRLLCQRQTDGQRAVVRFPGDRCAFRL